MHKPKIIEKTVYFVRHGQSEANVSHIFQPVDSPLTEVGKQQAKQIAERIGKLSFETLIVSPFPRTKETAECITQKTGKAPEYCDLFIERGKPSGLGGKSYDDPEADGLWKEWEHSLYTSGVRAGDGENFDDIIARADKALDFLRQRKEKVLVVVTHGFFLRTIIARVILGTLLTPESFRNFHATVGMENTGLSVLTYGTVYEGTSWRLWIYNDHAHLG